MFCWRGKDLNVSVQQASSWSLYNWAQMKYVCVCVCVCACVCIETGSYL